MALRIETPRFLLRDFRETDRRPFVTYQMDPRYRRLYGFGADDESRPSELFDRFLSWQRQRPRRNFQVGIFTMSGEQLCGCCGLRRPQDTPVRSAVLGIELAPEYWGRYRLAVDASIALIEYAFSVLDLDRIVGSTSSGNRCVARLAEWFGAEVIARRDGPAWMAERGWVEVDWALSCDSWKRPRLTTRDGAA